MAEDKGPFATDQEPARRGSPRLSAVSCRLSADAGAASCAGIEAWLATAPRDLRVGLLSHQAALLSTGETAAQACRRVFGENLRALFGPEHGYFGVAAAGERTASATHPLWGIPVHSLYGQHRKPTPEMLAGLDLLIVDLQDLGVRCYTYLATLLLTLEACAEAKLPCLVCDRPIPWHTIEDGPVAEPEHFSFVAPCALPLVHGRLPTEIAAFSGLPHLAAPMTAPCPPFERPPVPEFIPPSPAIRSWETARIYPATVFAEALPQLDIARATAYAFRVLSAPWFEGERLAAELNALALPGITFHDFTQAPDQGAIRLHVTNARIFRPWAVTCALLRTLHRRYGPERLFAHPQARPEWMTKLCGTEAWRAELDA